MSARRRPSFEDLALLGRDVQRRAGIGALVLGGLLLLVGTWSVLTQLQAVPQAAERAVGDWWAAGLLVLAAALLARGERAIGGLLGVVAVVVLLTRHVPGDLVAPAILILSGVVVLSSATRARRWWSDGSSTAFFGDRRVVLDPGSHRRSVLAVFGDTEARLDGADGGARVIDCLAVFGSVELTVPRDAAVHVREVAVFGDVTAPPPPAGPAGPAGPAVSVRSIAVFGDVRLRRG